MPSDQTADQPVEPAQCTNLPGCPVHPEASPFHTHAADATRTYPMPPAEPQQADASPLLDLVRQYGAQIANRVEAIENHSDESPFEHAAETLFARIAALVPQQPVQARDANGELLWQHGCGLVEQSHERPGPDRCGQADPESWRPLLAGGAHWQPARPDDTPGALVPGEADEPPRVDLIAQVMAELGVDRPEDVLERLSWLRRRVGEQGREFVVATAEAEWYLKERDEARAEVERLSDERAAAMSSEHSCPGCRAPGIPRNQLACKPCWFRLPPDLRNAINGSFRARTSARLPNTRAAAATAHRRALAAALAWYRNNPKRPQQVDDERSNRS